MYIDIDGNTYQSKEDYYNSPDLELEDIYMYLLSGKRTPQNESESEIKAEMDKIQASGGIVETSLNF